MDWPASLPVARIDHVLGKGDTEILMTPASHSPPRPDGG
jgi:hypothetical protein